MNGITIFGNAAIRGVRRAADMDSGRHGPLHHQKIRAPIAERQHEAQPRNQAEHFHAHRILGCAPRIAPGVRHHLRASRAAMPLQPPVFITTKIANGAKPSTIRKNCNTSL